jgi:hypothetical protein
LADATLLGLGTGEEGSAGGGIPRLVPAVLYYLVRTALCLYTLAGESEGRGGVLETAQVCVGNVVVDGGGLDILARVIIVFVLVS